MSATLREPSVRLSVDGSVATILLDAPSQHNALGGADILAFREHLDRIDADPTVRVLVVTGAGTDTFCAGASLAEMESGAMSGALFETLTDRLASVRVPAVCALNGDVYGGGAEIALCCDFRVGVEGMRLRVPAARLGVCYPLGGLSRWVQRLGIGVAARVFLSGEELEAQELLRVGYLTQVVARVELTPTVERLAERLASGAPLAVQAMKLILGAIAAGTLDPVAAADLAERCNASEDLREGLRARREGRSPDFRGR
jgi:enoyl-CoA hydratase/carnithine racemase